MTRIAKLTTPAGDVWYVPQYTNPSNQWLEYICFDPDSPYMHVKMSQNIKEIQDFLENPSILNSRGWTIEVVEKSPHFGAGEYIPGLPK